MKNGAWKRRFSQWLMLYFFTDAAGAAGAAGFAGVAAAVNAGAAAGAAGAPATAGGG
jgi:hypothetical protein